jgi:hypothetical protein
LRRHLGRRPARAWQDFLLYRRKTWRPREVAASSRATQHHWDLSTGLPGLGAHDLSPSLPASFCDRASMTGLRDPSFRLLPTAWTASRSPSRDGCLIVTLIAVAHFLTPCKGRAPPWLSQRERERERERGGFSLLHSVHTPIPEFFRCFQSGVWGHGTGSLAIQCAVSW